MQEKDTKLINNKTEVNSEKLEDKKLTRDIVTILVVIFSLSSPLLYVLCFNILRMFIQENAEILNKFSEHVNLWLDMLKQGFVIVLVFYFAKQKQNGKDDCK